MAIQRTQAEWARHARLIGEITERSALVLSNTAKERIRDSIAEIEAQCKREWYERNKTKAKSPGTPPTRHTEGDEEDFSWGGGA